MSSSIDREVAYRLFAAAIELAPQHRAAFLEAECRGNTALRAEVEEYLRSASTDSSVTSALRGAPLVVSESLAGRTVGRFRLLEHIGEGGMGVVYRAERIDGVKQAVAVKLVSSSLDSSARRRFEREAQLLARLEHPSIARLIDAGITEERAWIAIEFVRGVRIDEYCTAQQLAAPDIVKLMVELADAVAAAHALLVVHSDIKPSNVLITSEGVPKLIDFGISTALRDTDASDSPTLHTGWLFSPNYAAPEQIAGTAITVATDVFGLGALAYRLLTGSPVHRTAQSAVPYAVAVTERDVELPSHAALATDRSVTWARRLRGDLDAILSKALEREPARRYVSAAAMGADLSRYLEGRPVLAAKTTAAYRLQKFVRRNALAVSLSSLLIASLAAGALITALQAHRAAVARDEARAVTRFLTNDILAAANPMLAGTRDVQLRPLLDGAVGTLEQRFAGQPTVLAEVQAAMGSGYAALFETAKAEALLTAAEKGLARELGDSDVETQNARSALWYLYTSNIDVGKLYKLSARIAAAEDAAGRPDSEAALRAKLMLAWIPCVAKAAAVVGLSNCGGVVRAFYDAARRRFGPDARATAEMAWFLGVALTYSSREDQAEPALREACNGLQHYFGAVHHRMTSCRRYLADALDANGKSAEAEALLQGVVRNYSTTLGPDSQFTAVAEYDLLGAELHLDHVALAVDAGRRAVAAMERPGCDCDDDLWRTEARLADALVRNGQAREGLALGEQVLALAAARRGIGAPSVIAVRAIAAESYLHAGDPARAEELARINLEQSEALAKRPEWLVGWSELALANALVAAHRSSEASPFVAHAVAVLSRELGPANFRTRLAVAARRALPAR